MMSAASALAPIVTLDADTFDYVIHKSPNTCFSPSDSGHLESLSSLRVFGLRKGFKELGELPGHFVVNAWTGAEPAS